MSNTTVPFPPAPAAPPAAPGAHAHLPTPSPSRGAAGVAGTLLGTIALVLLLPFALIAVAAPVGLALRGLLWLAGIR